MVVLVYMRMPYAYANLGVYMGTHIDAGATRDMEILNYLCRF